MKQTFSYNPTLYHNVQSNRGTYRTITVMDDWLTLSPYENRSLEESILDESL